MTTLRRLLPVPVRRWLYGVAAASVPVAVHYDLMDPEAAALLLPLVVALLNVRDEPEDPQD